MSEHDGHDHNIRNLSSINNAFYIGIALNSIFTIIEFVVGYYYNSLALIADASHNLGDVASLIISLIGIKLTQKAASLAYTYGYKKASILASLINAVLLIFIVFNIFTEAWERLNSPVEIIGTAIIITASIGVLINTISAFLFYKGQKDDINIKGAFIHLLVDALVSVGVVVSGIIIHYTNWNVIDPIISFVISIVIILSTWGLFKESIKLILDGIPKGLDLAKMKETILSEPNIKDVHHIHVWALSSTENALTAHVVFKNDTSLDEMMKSKKEIKHKLEHAEIHHVTLEIENDSCECTDHHC